MRTLILVAAVTGLFVAGPVSADVGLDGYCPVCVIKKGGKWVKGDPNITASYDGVTYQFPYEGARDAFAAAPERFVPALGGDCIVCYANKGKRVPGSVNFAASYEGRIYLFPGAGEKQVFLDDPAKYADADLAAGGNCIVCKVKAGKEVPGNTAFTAIHNGLRYLFPSDKERAAFLAEPATFASVAMAGEKAMKAEKAMIGDKPMATDLVSVEGRSGCAACEFRVHPLNDPDKLGLAVRTDDGAVYVIEGAHAQYAQIYEDRFEQLRLSVSGKALKSEGNVTWIEPVAVAVVN